MKNYTNNSFSHMQALIGGQVSLKYPQKLYLDITQDCNMNCIMCRDKITASGKTMNLDLFKKIVDETASYVSSYSLFNWGEPLILKDFRERVEYLGSKKRKDATIDNEGMFNDLYPTKIGDYVWDGNDYCHVSNYFIDRNCNAPFVSASIGYNGDIYLCCNVGDLVDNVNEKSFFEIWSGERYDTLRKDVNDVNLMPDRCKNCAWFNR